MQAAFCFVLKPPLTSKQGLTHPQGPYVKYLNDPGQLVDWKEVFEAFYKSDDGREVMFSVKGVRRELGQTLSKHTVFSTFQHTNIKIKW